MNNFDDALTIPFSVSVDSVKDSFLKWSYNLHETPVDILNNSKLICINKMYFPIRFFHDINYTAHWNALSIWEHKEQYIEYESKAVFLDESGGEHTTSTGAKLCSGKTYTPQAVSKIVPVTKFKLIIDKKEQTSGQIQENVTSQYVNYQDFVSENFINWTENIAKHNNDNLDINNNISCPIHDLYGNNEVAFRKIKNELQINAESLCKNNVPGNRFTNFEISSFDCNYIVDIILIPLYEIKYEYKNKEYLYYTNGTNVNDILSESHPIDNVFLENSIKSENEIKQLSSTINFLSKLTKFIFPIIIALGIISMTILGVGVVLTSACVLCEIFCLMILKRNKTRINNLKSELDTIKNNRQYSRNDINKK